MSVEIGVHAVPYNHRMRMARKRAGFTQRELGELCGVGQNTISAVETFRLRVPPRLAREIALVLGCQLDWLFPPEVARSRSFPRGVSVDFVMRVESLDALAATDERLLIEGPALEMERADRVRSLGKMLDRLPGRLREVLDLRYGLTDGVGMTLRETGEALGGVTVARVREMQGKALRILRHPDYRKRFQERAKARR